MTSAASNYQESSHFIHQRYDDTAHVIFQQQEKVRQDEKRRQKHSSPFSASKLTSSPPQQLPEFSRYGNHGVVALESKKSPVVQDPVKPPESPGSPSAQSSVKSSSERVDGARPKRRHRRRHSRTVFLLETNV